MQHANSPLTPKGRHRMVALVEERGFTFEAAAAASNVARSTCWEWVRRRRRASEDERRTLACLGERSSRPKSSPAQVPDAEARKICERREKTGWSPRRLADELDIGRPHSTVHRVLRRGGCSRRPRPEPPAVIRYEWPCPGNRDGSNRASPASSVSASIEAVRSWPTLMSIRPKRAIS